MGGRKQDSQEAAKNSMAALFGVFAQNDGVANERAGDFAAAEEAYLEAISSKERSNGVHSFAVAYSKDSLGALYLKMGRLDDAQRVLEDAERIYGSTLPPFPPKTRIDLSL